MLSKNVQIFSIVAATLAIVYQYYSSNNKAVINNVTSNIFTEDKLAEYDGVIHDKLYLALLGNIYDVTEGRRHYDKGAPYNYFTGKDGSRAFVTGEFSNEGPNRDHVIDLSCDMLLDLMGWSDTLREKYIYVGTLVGRYYDNEGQKTQYAIELTKKIKNCELEKEALKKEELRYPPCNSQWSADTGSRVWCTNVSGGIKRSWVGVPRQYYRPGDKDPRCVCVNLEEETSMSSFQEYADCKPDAVSCFIGNKEN